MEKKTYPQIYAGKKMRFARSVVVDDLVFLSGSSGRTIETGEVSSDKVNDQMVVALDKVRGDQYPHEQNANDCDQGPHLAGSYRYAFTAVYSNQ